MDIGKGDWVEAIRTSPSGGVQSGSVYFVEEVISIPPGLTCKVCGKGADDGEFGVRLSGAKVRGKLAESYGASRCYVRPVRKPPEETIIKKEKVDA